MAKAMPMTTMRRMPSRARIISPTRWRARRFIVPPSAASSGRSASASTIGRSSGPSGPADDLQLSHGLAALHACMDVVAFAQSNYGLRFGLPAKGIEIMRDYLSPERQRVALLTIAAQRDFFLPNSPAKVGGSMAVVPSMVRLVEGFRQRGRPIVRGIRLYRCDGSNVELCNRASIEEGQRIVMPGTLGAELVDRLKPDQQQRLDSSQLFEGKLQELGRHEWIMYQPRWSAFYQTPLEDHLRHLGVTTLVISGCNFPNGPLATVYAACNRDF